MIVYHEEDRICKEDLVKLECLLPFRIKRFGDDPRLLDRDIRCDNSTERIARATNVTSGNVSSAMDGDASTTSKSRRIAALAFNQLVMCQHTTNIDGHLVIRDCGS